MKFFCDKKILSKRFQNAFHLILCPIILSLLFYAILTKHSFSKRGLNQRFLNLQRKKNCEAVVLRIKMISSPILILNGSNNQVRNFKSIFSLIVLNNRYKCHFHFILFFLSKINPNEYKIIMQFLNWLLDPARNKIHNFFISFEV